MRRVQIRPRERPPLDRYSRQARFGPLGAEGQAALEAARATIVGCGALGSVAADLLARAGVRALRLIDRDVLDVTNLHRVALMDEADVRDGLPKSVALARHLGRVRADLAVEPVVADLDGANALGLLRDADVVLDGTDNFEARHVLNEACLELATPWVHAAVLGAQALAWAVVPGGACYACLVPDAPAPGEVATCETAGVLGAAVHVAASLQVGEAMKLLSRRAAPLDGPRSVDVWTGETSRVRAARDPQCATCAGGERRWLGRARAGDAVACGRGAVQVRGGGAADLERLRSRLDGCADVRLNSFVLRFTADGRDLTVFRDGRVLVAGTRDVAEARGLVARYLGR